MNVPIAAATQPEPPAGKRKIAGRWRLRTQEASSPRVHKLVIASCIFAVMAGTLVAIASLPTLHRPTVLVGLYLHPGEEACGIDAPHAPVADQLFGLVPINHPSNIGNALPPEQVPNQETGEAPASNSPQASSDASSTNAVTRDANSPPTASPATANPESTDAAHSDPSHPPSVATASQAVALKMDLRTALNQRLVYEQLVLHVSTLARVENGQVWLYGFDAAHQNSTTISLAEVISTVRECRSRRKLLVLDFFWPTLSDQGNAEARLALLYEATKKQLANSDLTHLHVLLASTTTPSRGIPGQTSSLLAAGFQQAIQEHAADQRQGKAMPLADLVKTAAANIASRSSQWGSPQQIEWLPASPDFTLISHLSTTQSEDRPYPASLKKAWQLRDDCIANAQLPYQETGIETWGKALSLIESDWRRGAPDVEINRAINSFLVIQTERINRALATRAAVRSDSLQLACQRFEPTPVPTNLRALAVELLKSVNEIHRSTPVEARPAAIDAVIAKYLTEVGPNSNSPLQALEAVLAVTEEAAQIDPATLSLVNRLHQLIKGSSAYPVLDGLRCLLETNADTQRITAVMRLLRLLEQLGTDSEATAFLLPRHTQATLKAVQALQLACESGLTRDEVINEHLFAALKEIQKAKSEEQSFSIALRRLRVALDTISLDRELGSPWVAGTDFQELLHQAENLLNVMEQAKHAVAQGDTACSSLLTKIDHGSETFVRRWARAVDQQATLVLASPRQTNRALSAGLSATDRTQFYQTLETVSRSLLVPDRPVLGRADDNRLGDSHLELLRERLRSLTQATPERYRQWLAAYLGTAQSLNCFPSYRAIAERNGWSGYSVDIPIGIEHDLASLTWDQPRATVRLQNLVDLAEAKSIRYRFLAPAAASLKITPPSGIVHPNEAVNIQWQLAESDSELSDKFLEGAWLKLTYGDQTQLKPLRITKQPAQPSFHIDFGPTAITHGRTVTLERWPDRRPQPLDWQLRSHDPAIAAVIVTLDSADGTKLESAPLPCTPQQPIPIRFLPPLPSSSNSNVATASSKTSLTSNSAISSSQLTGDLTLTVRDAAKGTVLGTWAVSTQLLDPRQFITLGKAKYEVTGDGENQLTVNLSLSPTLPNALRAQPLPEVRLELNPDQIDRLLDFSTSRCQANLALDGSASQLSAKNLRFLEGAEPLVDLPLSVNGDPGYYALAGRFPLRRGTVQFPWKHDLELQIVAPKAVVGDQGIGIKILARNLQDHQRLYVELETADEFENRSAPVSNPNGSQTVLWQCELPTARNLAPIFTCGGEQVTLQILAARRDWELMIPTHFGSGPHRIRVTTMNPIGTAFVEAEHRFEVDDTLPTHPSARAETTSDETTVYIDLHPGPSGIKELIVASDAISADQKIKPIPAIRLNEAGSWWSLVWPQELPLAKRLELSVTTGAGKQGTMMTDVVVQTLKPVGRLTGTVYEGSLVQPGLTVYLLGTDGSIVASVRTDQQGSYSFVVDPGNYHLAVEKSATRREARSPVTVQRQAVTNTDLNLTRAPPQRGA